MPRIQAEANARAFLAAYRQCGEITAAAAAAKIDKTNHYRWLKSSESYRVAFALAQKDFEELRLETVRQIESKALARARDGVLEPVFYQGIKCGAVRRWPEGTVQFLLRAHMPEIYGQKVAVGGPDGGPIQTKIEVTFVDPKPETR